MAVAQKSVTKKQIDEQTELIDSLFKELTDTKIIFMGKEYPLSGWITLSEYAKKYHVHQSTVSKWIAREIIPFDCLIMIPELNYLKLVKDRPYETRKYEPRGE